jgi:hypothetical protein
MPKTNTREATQSDKEPSIVTTTIIINDIHGPHPESDLYPLQHTALNDPPET